MGKYIISDFQKNLGRDQNLVNDIGEININEVRSPDGKCSLMRIGSSVIVLQLTGESHENDTNSRQRLPYR